MREYCFLIGKHDAPERIRDSLDRAVEECAADGITLFVVGSRGNFDRLAAQSVLRLKHRRAEVTLLLLLAYHPAERPADLPDGFDGTLYPEGMERVPRRFAIARANERVAGGARRIIAYTDGTPGGTERLLRRAEAYERTGKCRIVLLSRL